MPSASDTAGESLNTRSPGAVLGEGVIYHLKGTPPPLVMKLVPKHCSCLCFFRTSGGPISSLSFSTPAAPRDLESGCGLPSCFHYFILAPELLSHYPLKSSSFDLKTKSEVLPSRTRLPAPSLHLSPLWAVLPLRVTQPWARPPPLRDLFS